MLEEFQHWAAVRKNEFCLGNSLVLRVENDLAAFIMVAQHGYGESVIPRIRYSALEKCLKTLADEAVKQHASVHMPRIGCGEAGGSWQIVKEMIDDFLCQRGIDVTIYDLPNKNKPVEKQKSLF